MFLVWWLVWIAAVALVSVGAAELFPTQRLAILVVDMALFFAFPGYAAGREWTAMSRRIRVYAAWFAATLVFGPTACDLAKESIGRKQALLICHLELGAATAAGLLAGFYLGRRRTRRRTGRADASQSR